MLGFASGWVSITIIVPDGTIAADDRAKLLQLYGGIPLDSPSVGGVVINQFMSSNVGADLYNGTLQ